METQNKAMSPTVLLIGSGKLAQHLNYWFHLFNYPNPLLTWDRHQDPQALRKYILQATHIWMAISDSALTPFYNQYLEGHDKTVVHFSGALHDDRMIAAHPLMSFTGQLYTDEFYKKIQFALTGTTELTTALPYFSNLFFCIKPADKPLYHALCVMAGNFPQILWKEIYRLAQDYKIPPEAFDLYVQKITQNFVELKDKALTGPLIRKDHVTLEKNEQALAGTHLQPIYQSFKKEFSI